MLSSTYKVHDFEAIVIGHEGSGPRGARHNRAVMFDGDSVGFELKRRDYGVHVSG